MMHKYKKVTTSHKNRQQSKNENGKKLTDNRPKSIAQRMVINTNSTAPIQLGGGWKTGKVEKDIKAERKGKDSTLVDTAHHILPKSKLLAAHAKLSAAEQEQLGKDMGGSEALTENQLQSLQFNLTLGPRPEQRTDDPGDEFDPNLASGQITPRSSALKKAVDGTGGIDHTKLAAALKAAKKAHDADKKMDRSKWSKGADGKYTRV